MITRNLPCNYKGGILTAELEYKNIISGLLQLRSRLILIDYQLVDQVLRRDLFKIRHANQFKELTNREVEVLKLLGGGLNNPAIAKKLLISRSTVETHRKHLNRKLDIKSYGQLVKYALAFDMVQF